MANSKVQLADGTVLMDLTEDSVTAASLAQGYTAHDAAGNQIVGEFVVDSYTRAETLLPDTAAVFGLPNDSVPNDIFDWIGTFNTHFWGKCSVTYSTVLANAQNAPLAINDATSIQFSSDIAVNSQGILDLVNPSSVGVAIRDVQILQSNAPCYIKAMGKLYYIPSGATCGTATTMASLTYTIGLLSKGTGSYPKGVYFGSPTNENRVGKSVNLEVALGEEVLVHSSARNAHPDSGIADGYSWRYLGVPFEKLPLSLRSARGSYIGTGTYGPGTPNSVQLPFTPSLLLIYGEASSAMTGPYMWGNAHFYVANGTSIADNIVSCSGNAISWYTSGGTAALQLNESGITYNWIAIG